MRAILRKAKPEDAAAMVAIKKQLPLTLSDGGEVKGGFLLGATEEEYRDFITSAYCYVAEADKEVVGFAIVLPDAELRRSGIWKRRSSAHWKVDIDAYELQTLSYFEQFAFLPGYRRAAVALAANMVRLAFDAGATAMFTTTVRKPVVNLAAIPFIDAAHGVHAGAIDEHYPAVGQILSDIYVLKRDAFYRNYHSHPLIHLFRTNPLN